ncbi:MAG: hypothetical protein GW795_09990 [Cyanobacteria bacterium]|nr:hypothetical protein [Cyanobacteria bacterium CG_2015-16_32_12]NCO77834.1 hypothetical protein [Cyanobacteria bacterium CG_2015-22_32_23]NCQ05001.1 hypothetical protein [Cyanobacteria bacterium CG_2015-09_32_10]NCQ42197.1 hypothetical protein [Cyanobacteria bacterium CG_2015-04_32_10]NCS86179.1 hypothetical protein [Cyanobacteria bacterium CG_2015-02_32_10]
MNLQTLLTPPFESLVKEIHAVNHSWKLAADEIFNNEHFLAKSLRDLKVRLQVKLLRNYAPNFVYLIEDKEIVSEEVLYSLQLISNVDNYQDAAHLPIRVAKEVLSLEEINKFSKKYQL